MFKRGHYDAALEREIARRYLAGDFSYGVAAETASAGDNPDRGDDATCQPFP